MPLAQPCGCKNTDRVDVEIQWGGACSGLWALNNQSRLGFSRRGLEEKGTKTKCSDKGGIKSAIGMRNVFFENLIIETFWKYEPENELFFLSSSRANMIYNVFFKTVVMKQKWNQLSRLSPYFHKHLHPFSLKTLQALSVQTPTQLTVKQQRLHSEWKADFKRMSDRNDRCGGICP